MAAFRNFWNKFVRSHCVNAGCVLAQLYNKAFLFIRLFFHCTCFHSLHFTLLSQLRWLLFFSWFQRFLIFPHICSCLWLSRQVLCYLYDVIQTLKLYTKPFVTYMSYWGFCIKIKVFWNNTISVGKYLSTFRRSLLLSYLGKSKY
jgi:hypothetical protein